MRVTVALAFNIKSQRDNETHILRQQLRLVFQFLHWTLYAYNGNKVFVLLNIRHAVFTWIMYRTAYALIRAHFHSTAMYIVQCTSLQCTQCSIVNTMQTPCSLQHFETETPANLWRIICEFAFALMRFHCSLLLRFTVFCAFVNIPAFCCVDCRRSVHHSSGLVHRSLHLCRCSQKNSRS